MLLCCQWASCKNLSYKRIHFKRVAFINFLVFRSGPDLVVRVVKI